MDLIEIIPVDKLPNALREDPWGVGVTVQGIRRALQNDEYRDTPIEPGDRNTARHEARIAHFVRCGEGWDDPIYIDVGVPSLGCNPSWIIDDGNHRVAAAQYASRPTIMAHISGDIKHAEAILGFKFREPTPIKKP